MKFKNSPLVEAIFELTFVSNNEEYDPTLPGLFYSEINENYTEKKEIPSFQYEVIQNDGSLKKITNPLTRFSDNDGNHIQLSKDLLVFNKLRPNVEWLTLKKNILDHSEKYININKNNNVGFIRLKFVNYIFLPISEKIDNVFSFNLPTPDKKNYTNTSKFNIENHFNYDDFAVRFIIREIEPDDENHRVFFEISIYKVETFEYDRNKIEEWLTQAHSAILKIFLDSMNKDLLKKYKDA